MTVSRDTVDSRIIYVSRKHPPSTGGMQKLSQRLLAELRRRREVFAIVYDCPRLLLAPFIAWVVLRLFWELYVTRRATQVVHFGDPLLAIAAPLCKARGVPTVVTVHGLDITYPNRLYQWLLDIGLGRVDLFVCISSAARHSCLRRGIPPEKCEVIPPGVDHVGRPSKAFQERVELRKGLGIEPARTVLLTVGRLVRRKGVLWFVEEVIPRLKARVPSLCYLVVGEGPDREAIMAAAARAGLGDAVVLTGRIDDDTLATCLAVADIFVMPNIKVSGDMEGFGLVALEAAAAELPVVAADLEGIRDAIVHEENGLLVAAENADAFTETILGLIQDPRQRLRIGQRAREYTFQKYSWGRMAESYLDLYHAVAAKMTPDLGGRSSGDHS